LAPKRFESEFPYAGGQPVFSRNGRDYFVARNPAQIDQRRESGNRHWLPSASEDNDTVAAADFKHAAADGAFAVWWEAHGNGYGIPSSIDDDIRRGRTVVCNVSRTIVAAARLRYAQVAVVLVTAPVKVLKARLATRGRASDGTIDERVKRSEEMQPCEADFVIGNTGWLEIGVYRLVNVIRDCGFYVIY